MIGSCLQGQINGFIQNCASTQATTANCNTWSNDPNNASCVACILPNGTDSNGVLVNAQGGFFTSNVPGCIALVDPTHGPKCAQELEPLLQCQYAACANCPLGSHGCFATAAAPGGPCAQYTIPDCGSDYFTDGGTFNNQCSGSTADNGTEAVLNVICGTGT
jgi:hypothetical protein